jgi:uncharacterized protein YjiK/2',3'-cyclic-nucleotide 2'-phosphodiesterase (5'-nucleotidase family)
MKKIFITKTSKLSVFVLTILLGLIGFNQTSNAQTTFVVGDISIIGFNSSAPDNFAFVSWVNIAPNTYIKFTDNGFLSSGSANATSNGRGGENFVIWRNSTGNTITAGTVITMQGITTSLGTATAGSTNGLDGISNSGDQIFAYQGTATTGTSPDWSSNVNPTTFNGTILFGLTFQGSGSINTWLSTGSATSNTSYLPSQLNAVNGNIAVASSASRGQYTGSRTNQTSLADYKSLVTNPSNWTTGSGAGIITLDATAFTIVPNPTVNLSVSTNSATESPATVVTVTATASAAVTGNQTVSLGVSGTGITAGDYNLSNATITIPNGLTTGSVTFTIINDNDVEGTETATLTISSPSAGITLGTPTTQNITIADDDFPANPTVGLSVSTNSASESAATVVTVTATASSAVTGNQTVIVGVSGTGITAGDYNLSNTTITIPDGLTTGTVTFTIVNDNDVEGTETATLTISSPSAGITLGTPTTQNITITDNDVALDINLCNYVRVGRYDLPEPTRTTPPANSVLAQEVSGVTYNWDLNTLFVVGDGGTSVVQVSKTGQLINSMTLAPGGSPQGTEFYDPEGITYIGNGKFVMTEERDRNAVLFTYVAGTTLTRAAAQTVQLGTFVQNIGLEGLTYDPITGGYIFVKEITPLGIFQTDIDFNAGTATNGSSSTVNSIDIFNPSLTGLSDFADVYALANIPTLSASGNLLVLSQEDGKIVNISRTGVISSSLKIVSDPGNPLTVAAQQHEGLTMDNDGILYVVSENGGGDFDHPQLWVYAPSVAANQAPTAITLSNSVTSILENTSTTARIKLADINVVDDGLVCNNTLSLSGPDASSLEIIGTELFLKAGTVLDFETKTSYTVTINVDDASLGSTPDATLNYTLSVTDVVIETPTGVTLIVSEVAPWSSGNSPVAGDWFELTNTGTVAVNISGWKVDDNSNSFASSVALNGITSIAPGESVIFIESASPATIVPLFKSNWFGANPPASLQVGTYTGGGIGLSTGGDAVNIFNAAGELQAKVIFGSSPAGPSFPTFNNAIGLNNTTISTLSVVGVNDAFVAINSAVEIGSPGSIGKLYITEVAPWSSGNSPVGADWFEVTNTKATAVDITGWKIDDNSGSPAAAVVLNGITSIAPGESVIFLESATPATAVPAFLSNWFGANPPATLQVGTYTGSGVGLGTGGDQVNLYNNAGVGVLQASVSFGASPTGPYRTFDNAAKLNSITPAITLLSSVGVNGAFIAFNSNAEIGSPGRIVTAACPTITVTATQGAAIACNGGTTTVTVTVAGGIAPYTGTGTFTVGAGTYNYTVTDAYGCTGTASITITQPTTALVAASIATQADCSGSGSVTVTATGGTAPYTGTGIFTTPAGAYSYTVTDANGCTSITTGTVAVLPAAAVNLSVSTNSASETAATVVTVTATASAPVCGNQTVSLGVSGTGITAGDYTLSNSTITILDGQTTGSVTFTVVNENVVETTETAVLTISSPSSGIVLGGTTTQNITISDFVFTLQVLHASDFEAAVEAVADAPRFAAIVDTLEGTYANTIKLSSGDNYIPGPFLSSGEDPSLAAAFKTAYESYYNTTFNVSSVNLLPSIGRADISIMNFIGIEASALGNHEFDLGTTEVRNIIRGANSSATVRSWFGAQFPYLSANLNFSGDGNLSAIATTNRLLPNTAFRSNPSESVSTITNKLKLAPSTIINKGGQKIGIVGATTQVLASISSPGATTVVGGGANDMTILAGILQPVINDLIADGCNKIILLSHLQQIAFEKELAGKLSGVDIIMAGGSNTLMADGNDRLRAGDVAVETYPFLTTGLDGKAIALINTDGNYKYVGRLVVDFDAAGTLIPSSIDPVISGVYAADAQGVNDAWGANVGNAFAVGTRGYQVQLLCTAIGNVITVKDGNLFGKTSVFLEGRRNFVRTEETNLGNVSAEANLWLAKFYDPTTVISIKNGGGIRSAIGNVIAVGNNVTLVPPIANPSAGKQSGDISQLDIENSLRFNNQLSLVTLTASGMRSILENAVAATTATATPGQFAQVAGVRYSYNFSLPAGSRILNAVVTNAAGNIVDTLVLNGTTYGNLSRTFRVVTLNFLAGGGDGYPFNTLGTNRVDLNTVPAQGPALASFTNAGSEQDAFAEYMKNQFSSTPYGIAETALAQDCRIQRVPARTDNVLPPNPGTNGTLVTCDATPVTESQLFAALGGTPATGGTWSPALAGAGVYTYTVTSASCSGSASAKVTVTTPVTALVVSGLTNVCPFIGTGQQLTYSVVADPAATSYQWTVPPTVTLVSGQGTNSIQVTIGSGFIANANKVIKVRSLSSCGNSSETLFYLLAQLPSTPGSISGPVSVCAFLGAGSATYSVAAVTGASSYIWAAQAGTIITYPNGNGVNGNTVNISFPAGFTTSSITVRSANDCGTSAARSLQLVRANPSTPGLISGPTNACAFILPGATVAATYSINPVAGATSYNWVTPPGSVVTHPNGSGVNDVIITVLYPAGFTGGTISVSATNGCGTSGVRNLNISKLNPATPGVIDVVQTGSCPTRQFTYTIAGLPSNATSIQWTVPAPATLVSGQGTTSITVTYPATVVEGIVTATAISNCGSSVARQTPVKLPACPPALPFTRITTTEGNTTAVKNDASSISVLLFPNPAISGANLKVETKAEGTINIRVIDVYGRTVIRTIVPAYKTTSFGSQLKSGTYFIEVTQGQNKVVEKLIVL